MDLILLKVRRDNIVDLNLVSQILTKAEANKLVNESTVSLKTVMDVYKSLKLNYCKEAKVYKLLLKICMNKQIPWEQAMKKKRKSQIKWENAIEHSRKVMTYKCLLYWMDLVKQRVHLKQSKENMYINVKEQPVELLNKSYILNKTIKETALSNKHQSIFELKATELQSKKLLIKGFKGLILNNEENQVKRQEKNNLIENLILAVEYHERKQCIKVLVGLERHYKLSKIETYIKQNTLSREFDKAKYFMFWFNRFCNFTY